MKNILSAFFISIIISSAFISCSGGDKKTLSSDTLKISDTLSPEIAKVNKEIAADPNNPELYNKRAILLYDIAKLDEAFADIRTALNLDSSKADYFLTLSDIYFGKGKISNCKKSIEKAMQLDAKNANALLKYAELQLYFDEYKSTLEYITKALDIDKINAKAYYMRGMTYKLMGDTAKAVTNFQTTIDQDADYYHAYIQLGMLYAIKKSKLAEDYYNNAIKLNPKSIEAHFNIAVYYQDVEQFEEAVAEYDKVLQLNSKYKQAHYNLGYINLVYLLDYKQAIKHFTNAIACDAKYAEAYYNRGYAYELIKDYTSAKADYDKALDLKPNYEMPIKGLNRIDASVK
ncbi:MAG TPA: tetratricopeptide repeat protein [Bacteroidales bacterium]|nr:tetratricopeptide repeat protein [Bacteroidales bacterium]HPS17841.1 tetratricopeptide repeat protein [Bacteroidales bacterium]